MLIYTEKLKKFLNKRLIKNYEIALTSCTQADKKWVEVMDQVNKGIADKETIYNTMQLCDINDKKLQEIKESIYTEYERIYIIQSEKGINLLG